MGQIPRKGRDMRSIRRLGPYADALEAPSPDDPKTVVKLGVRSETFRYYQERRLNSAIAQYYGIVQDGMPSAWHAFRGLNRPLMDADDVHADQRVVVYTWRSPDDYEWAGTPQCGHPVRMEPPPRRVFVVLVRQEDPNEYGLFGSIDRWNWVREDPGLSQAPVDWSKRYGTKLWSRAE